MMQLCTTLCSDCVHCTTIQMREDAGTHPRTYYLSPICSHVRYSPRSRRLIRPTILLNDFWVFYKHSSTCSFSFPVPHCPPSPRSTLSSSPASPSSESVLEASRQTR